MKKKFLNTLAAALLTGAVAVSGLTACSSSDDSIAEETQQPAEAPAYRIVIPATIGDGNGTRAVDFDADGSTITSTFKTTDIIYAYNRTQDYFYQQTFAPDADAQSANLVYTDNMTYSYLDNIERWTVGDEILLMYKLTVKATTDVTGSYYLYSGDDSDWGQWGTASSASNHDFAVATVTVTDKTGTGTSEDPYVVTTSEATFTNLGSMFRQRFTFADADDNAIATPTVTKLVIRDANNKIVDTHYPLKAAAEQDYCYAIYLNNPDLSGDVYWAMRFAGVAGKITFLAYTSDSKVYEGAKDAPASGFANGKYYHSNTPIMMKPSTSVIQPTATGSVEYKANLNNCLMIKGDATVSGYSTGWYMRIHSSASGKTLTLDNASFYCTAQNSYVYVETPPFTFNLQGDNAYTSLGDVSAIDCLGTLTFTGNGTLALTCQKNDSYTNKGFFIRTNLSIVAASGHTLTVSDGVDNGDGTWTWVYTVRPTE